MMFDTGPKVCKSSHPQFKEVEKAIRGNQHQKALDLFDISSKLKRHSSGEFYVLDGLIYTSTNGVPMSDAMSSLVINFFESNLPFKPILAFWENVQKNKDVEAVKDLWDFLNHNKIPITEDGCFISYKKVNNDYSSCASGVWVKNESDEWVLDNSKHYDNSPGKVVNMPREKVNADRNQTCSSGLHCAAFTYATNFSNGRLIEVKVNPKDVVSVPVDYDRQKMRVCEYLSLGDALQEERDERIYNQSEASDYEIDNQYYDDENEEDNDDSEHVCHCDCCEEGREDSEDDEFEEEIENDDYEGSDEYFKTTGLEIKPDSRGRICVPSVVVAKLGLVNGDTVGIFSDSNTGEVTIMRSEINKNVNDSFDFYYIVDRSRNIRLGTKVLSIAGLDNKTVYIGYDEKENVIRITK